MKNNAYPIVSIPLHFGQMIIITIANEGRRIDGRRDARDAYPHPIDARHPDDGRQRGEELGGTATSTVIVCVEMEGKKAINYFGHGIVSTCSRCFVFPVPDCDVDAGEPGLFCSAAREPANQSLTM